jgi:thiamine kinase-like enzyme
MNKAEVLIQSLPIWQGALQITPLGGGITNVNMLVQDDVRRAVVRIGDDIPVHQIMRFNELAASRAAHAAGISPAVLYHAPGALVIDFIEGRTMTARDLQQDAVLDQALDLVARAHRDMPRHLRGPALTFWVFHVLRDYAGALRDGQSRHLALLADLMQDANLLEAAVGPVDLIFGHNDLLPANFLLDTNRMWLIDWDYAGFNSPLFDLGGLAANNGLSQQQEARMLEVYFGHCDGGLLRRYHAMKAAAALREAMWSMVSEIHSELDFDYAAYTASTLTTYRASFDAFAQT